MNLETLYREPAAIYFKRAGRWFWRDSSGKVHGPYGEKWEAQESARRDLTK